LFGKLPNERSVVNNYFRRSISPAKPRDRLHPHLDARPLEVECARLHQAAARGPAEPTRPTGFPGTAPVGPAMPVIEIAMSLGLFFSAPSAISRATSSLTAPKRFRVRGETPSIWRLAIVGVGDETAVDITLRCRKCA
jgi:hypothetical protein